MSITECRKCKEVHFDNDEICTLQCGHTFCWVCLKTYIESNLDSRIKCPFKCKEFIRDKIIRNALSEDYIEKYERLCIKSVSDKVGKTFKCCFNECESYIYYESDIQFECRICGLFNCTSCKGTHPFLKCSEYTKMKVQKRKKMEEEQFNEARIKLNIFKCERRRSELEVLESLPIIPSDEIFSCVICTKVVTKESSIKLRKCFHNFCKACLHDAVINSDNIPIMCPSTDCKLKLDERDIKGILTEVEYDRYLKRSTEIAKGMLRDIFHCKKLDCPYFVIAEDKTITQMTCKVCGSVNCLKCKVIHKSSETCEMYLDKKMGSFNVDDKTQKMIKDEIKSGKSMECPGCGSIIRKEGGCNWIKCPSCKLEICWILKIPRWGPKGRGDISGGCRCGVNNILCAPNCYLGCMPE